jgi:4-hydroxy-tetrahydrodipicolinate synthase
VTGFFVGRPVSGKHQETVMPTQFAPRATPQGIWLPLVTPFKDGEFDETSARRLARHYVSQPVDGFIVAATTGEGLTLDRNEIERYLAICRDEIDRAGRPVQLYLGVSGSDTRKVLEMLAQSASSPADGYLIVSPYYSRPSQLGLFRHFSALADNTTKPIMLYNIPYRTGVNLENDTLLKLAQHPRIAGLKDCATDAVQSFDLLRSRPAGFAVLTGEDALFYGALTHGADGGVLGSAHVATAAFAMVRDLLLAGDQRGALARWRTLVDLARLLFSEPSPAPIKHWLWRGGLIDSAEVRLPMTEVSERLAARIDAEVAAGRLVSAAG